MVLSGCCIWIDSESWLMVCVCPVDQKSTNCKLMTNIAFLQLLLFLSVSCRLAKLYVSLSLSHTHMLSLVLLILPFLLMLLSAELSPVREAHPDIWIGSLCPQRFSLSCSSLSPQFACHHLSLSLSVFASSVFWWPVFLPGLHGSEKVMWVRFYLSGETWSSSAYSWIHSLHLCFTVFM